MEADIVMPLFKKVIVAKEIVEVDVNVDPTLPMLKVVENSL
jgi:hypothetical protein